MAAQFHLQRAMTSLQIPMDRIQEFWRSRTEIQVGLPGSSVQRASLYLLVVLEKQQIALYGALHLLEDEQLVFYRCDLSGQERLGREQLWQLGEVFADSMGFVMDDARWPRLKDAERKKIWGRLLALETPSSASAAAPVMAPAPVAPPVDTATTAAESPLSTAGLIEARRKELLHQVGRLLASF